MKKGNLPNEEQFLSPEFVASLQQDAREYRAVEQDKSRKEWHFGRMVNDEWDALDADRKAELNKERFYHLCSQYMNAAVDFPIVGASGETLRRWCELELSYRNMPAFEAMSEALSFDHFRKARMLSNKGKVSVPAYALATAISEKLTADEMAYKFDPPQAPNEWERITGYIDSLQAMKLEFLNGSKAEFIQLVSRLRQIVEHETKVTA